MVSGRSLKEERGIVFGCIIFKICIINLSFNTLNDSGINLLIDLTQVFFPTCSKYLIEVIPMFLILPTQSLDQQSTLTYNVSDKLSGRTK